MTHALTRRATLIGAAFLMSAAALPALAQDKPVLRFSAVFSEQDIRADMMKQFGEAIADDFTLEPYYGGTLFKQGTELVALQRGNLEMGNIAPQDISNQIPAWSVLTSGHLFRDAAHLRAFFDSDVGTEFKKMAEDQLGVVILGPTYFGIRQVGLRIDKEIHTPADMAGIKLRMPGGDAWQFLGTALGANPTPMAYAEVYTGLQTGAIDGQDNPLPNVENMKFFEVMSQIVLTSHLVGYDLLVVSKTAWDAMSPEQQAEFRQRQPRRSISASKRISIASRVGRAVQERRLKITSPTCGAREQVQSQCSSPISPRTGLRASSTRSTRSGFEAWRPPPPRFSFEADVPPQF